MLVYNLSIADGWSVDSDMIGFADRTEGGRLLVGDCENKAPCVKTDFLRRRQNRSAACPEVIVSRWTCRRRASVAE